MLLSRASDDFLLALALIVVVIIEIERAVLRLPQASLRYIEVIVVLVLILLTHVRLS